MAAVAATAAAPAATALCQAQCARRGGAPASTLQPVASRSVSACTSATRAARTRSVAVRAVLDTAAPAASSISITKESPIEKLAGLSTNYIIVNCCGELVHNELQFAPWTLEGPNKSWTLWVCEPSEFPWEYTCVEHAYILQGTFFVTYEGQEPVKIIAGDFVQFNVGKTMFNVVEPVRKFYCLD